MSTKLPEPVASSNLSHAWARAFLASMQRSRTDITPLVVSIDGFIDGEPIEDMRVRRLLDAKLETTGNHVSIDSARTIFPFGEWNRRGRPHVSEFSSWYTGKYLPRIQARARGSKRHTYFERMISYTGVKVTNGKEVTTIVNQLECIAKDWHRERQHPKRPRQSALQVACFDPAKDHTGSALSGFPCLQQVSFAHDGKSGLAVNAYYPTQYIFNRAYGNYLGLSYLGCFMASELGLEMRRLNCYIARPEVGDLPKKHLSGLAQELESLLGSSPYVFPSRGLYNVDVEEHY